MALFIAYCRFVYFTDKPIERVVSEFGSCDYNFKTSETIIVIILVTSVRFSFTVPNSNCIMDLVRRP